MISYFIVHGLLFLLVLAAAVWVLRAVLRPVIHDAVVAGDIAALERHLATDAALAHARNMHGMTPLHCAAQEGQDAIARLLLDRGVEVSAASPKGATPLHYAAQEGHTAMTVLLLERGATVDATVDNGTTPLHFAAQGGYTEIVCLLLQYGASPDAAMHNGATPRDFARADSEVLAAMSASVLR